MQHTQSLCENKLFRALYARGKTAAAPCMAVYARKNRLKTMSRMGITCSVKLGGAAQRNRMRRRLREAYRIHEDRITAGWDLVVVARVRSAYASYAELERELLRSLDKLGVYRKGERRT